MTKTPAMRGRIDVEARGHVLIARLDGGPHGAKGPSMAKELAALLDKVGSDEAVRAVVLTGTHPGRFIGVRGQKVAPEDVVRQAIAALEAGQPELLADPTTHNVHAGLSSQPPVYVGTGG